MSASAPGPCEEERLGRTLLTFRGLLFLIGAPSVEDAARGAIKEID